MSLIEDLKRWYEENSYPPGGAELDLEYVDGEWQEKGTETKQISYQIIDTAQRWGDTIQAVYMRGEELVAVQDVEPATEMQSWGDYGDPEIYEVKAVIVPVVKYERVTNESKVPVAQMGDPFGESTEVVAEATTPEHLSEGW